MLRPTCCSLLLPVLAGVQVVVEAGRTVRSQYNVSMKTPLSEVVVVSADERLLAYCRSMESYIKEVRPTSAHARSISCRRWWVSVVVAVDGAWGGGGRVQLSRPR